MTSRKKATAGNPEQLAARGKRVCLSYREREHTCDLPFKNTHKETKANTQGSPLQMTAKTNKKQLFLQKTSNLKQKSKTPSKSTICPLTISPFNLPPGKQAIKKPRENESHGAFTKQLN